MSAGAISLSNLVGRIALVVMLAAVLVRGLTPSGFMLDRDASSGGVLVRICAASGSHGEAVFTRIALPDGDEQNGEEAGSTGCPCALAHSPAVPASRIEATAPHGVVAAADLPDQPRYVLPPKRGPPPPARGPPQSA